MNISKRTSWILIAVSGLLLLRNVYQILLVLLLNLFNVGNSASSIGIIGGADGPTAIYVTGNLLTSFLRPVVFFILEVFLCIFVLIKSIAALRKK